MSVAQEEVEKMRHSLSHVLAAAVQKMQELYPTTTFGVGPAIDKGFYYDIDFGDTKVADADLLKIEKEMRKIVAQKCELREREVSKEEALKWARENGQKYKVELIEEMPADEKITFYDMVVPETGR